MSRRDNGLDADDWTSVQDVEPPLTEHLLSALAEAGIAAYADSAPGPSVADSLVRVSSWSPIGFNGPMERLWVDRSERKAALAVIDQLLPELRAELDGTRRVAEDEAWQGIVAGFDAAAVEPAPQTLASEPAAADTLDAAAITESEAAEVVTGSEWDDLTAEDASESDEFDPFEDVDDEHYEPPEPDPIPKADAITRTAWIALIAGPLYLICALFFNWDASGLNGFLAIGGFVAGFVTLVARMKDPTDESDDGGAVL